MKIYHNPRCQKSRQTLELLHTHGHDPEIILYLTEIPTRSELKKITKMLGISAGELIRKGEQIYKDKYKGKELSEAQWIDAMIENPKLIERPIVINGNQAAIGRPPEKVLTII